MVINAFMKKLLILLIGLIVLIAAVSYFYFWRPSDSAIQNALTDVNNLQQSATETMPAAFTSLSTPVGITTEMTERFQQRVASYTKSLNALDKSPAIQRNNSTNELYQQYKATLVEHEKQLQSLSASVGIYGTILETCDRMATTIAESTPASLESESASGECSDALDKSSSSPNQIFNEQFLTNYVSEARKLLEAYRQYTTALNSSDKAKIAAASALVNSAKDNLRRPLYAKMDFKITPPPTDVFKNLTVALRNQQRSFLR